MNAKSESICFQCEHIRFIAGTQQCSKLRRVMFGTPLSCWEARQPGLPCGPEAKLFQAHPEEKQAEPIQQTNPTNPRKQTMKTILATILATLSLIACGGGTEEDYAAEEAAAVAEAASAPGVSTMPVDCKTNPEVCK